MHELSIASAILALALKGADERRISAVGVRIGHLRQVVPSSLTFSFALLAEGTAAEGARLEIEGVPVAGMCRGCGAESELRGFPFACGICGGTSLEVVRGEELRVEWLDVEEDAGARAEAPAA